MVYVYSHCPAVIRFTISNLRTQPDLVSLTGLAWPGIIVMFV